MGKIVKYTPCPECRKRGKDRRGDNLATYVDGGVHCFSCGFHRAARKVVFPPLSIPSQHGVLNGAKDKALLPTDFTREVPAAGWKWLLQYGLPYSYWKPYTGYSPSEERLILIHGDPIEISVGRYVGSNEGEGTGEPPRKWRQWGDKLRSATILERKDSGPDEVVVVEDIVSAHKIRETGYSSLPIFGSDLYPKAIMALKRARKPVALWLDLDQWGTIPKKINRLQAFLDVPVRFIKTDKDPKKYDTKDIQEILGLQ